MILALLCAILGTILIVESTTDGVDLAEVAPPTLRPAKPLPEAQPPSGFVMPPEDTFAEISERPLFFRSRRPISPEAQTKEEVAIDTSRPAFILSGVILAGTRRMALLQSQSSPKIARVEEGQQYEGWTIEAIQPSKVVLRRGQEVSEIVLEDKARPPLRRDKRDRRSARKRAQPQKPSENETGRKKMKKE